MHHHASALALALALALCLGGHAVAAAGTGPETAAGGRAQASLSATAAPGRQAQGDLPALVAEGVAFFASVLVLYLFTGIAADFVEAQWGAIFGSPEKAGAHLAGKIGPLALAVILALLVYPLVRWIAGVLLGAIGP
jgi:hypothetical protein